MLLHCLGETVDTYTGFAWFAPTYTYHGMFSILSTPDDLYGRPKLSDYSNPTAAPTVPPVKLSIFRLDKATRISALEVIGKDTLKVADYPHHIPRPLNHSKAQLSRALRRLQLNFSTHDSFEFFQVKVPPFDNPPIPASSSAAVLADFPNLRLLQLRFESTINFVSDPWEMYQSDTGEDSYPDGLAWGRFACHKVVVEWILCHAYQHISKPPKVELLGYIKRGSNEKREHIFNSKYRSDELNISIESQVQDIRGLPLSELPPRCFCIRRCGYVDMEPLVSGDEHGWPKWPSEEVVAKAYGTYVFDLEDSTDDGRFANGTVSEEEDRKYAAYHR